MPTIDQLSRASSIGDSDELALFSRKGRDTRKVTTSQLAAHVLKTIEGVPDETVYSLAMDGSNFTVSVLPAAQGSGVWAQITLEVDAPLGTIILPIADDRADGQEVLVTCTKAVAALVVNGSGAAILGAPTALAANGFFRLRFDAISSIWHRAG